MKEIFRVLKPGDISFHYIEVDSAKGLNNWAKKYPKLYTKYFINQECHFGLEYYINVIKRFKLQVFHLIKKLLAKMIILPWELIKQLNNEYKEKNFGVKLFTSFCSVVSKNIFLIGFLGFVLKPFQTRAH